MCAGRSVGLSSIAAFRAGRARAFLPDRRANTAMMFGLALVPILVATGVAIEFARGVMVHQRISEALDAAGLAVGNAPSKPTACASGSATDCPQALKDLANNYFHQNYDASKDDSCSTPADVNISISDQAVTLHAECSLKLDFLNLLPGVNIPSPTVGAQSTVVWGQTKLWVALVLDNSGSMSQGDRSGSKMSALQDAITNSSYGLLKTLQSAAANPGDVMVGIVPFTRSVNAGIDPGGANGVFIDWGEWEAPPANAGTLSINLGPGDSCPWSTGNQGYGCLSGSANNSGTTSRIPSSGLICPGQDNGRANKDHNARYYNGCYTSDPSPVTTTGASTNSTICSNSSSCTTSNYCRNYPKTSTSTSGHSTTVTTTTCNCTPNGSRSSCTATSTPPPPAAPPI